MRLIAPLRQHQSIDPAVVVVDETGKFVISLYSWRQGEADQLAQLVAHQLGAIPILSASANRSSLVRFAPVEGYPRILWIGIGCTRGTSQALIAQAVKQVCQMHHLATAAIAGIATIDRKADEEGLVEFCRDRQFPLKCFAAEALRTVPVPHPSTMVGAEVGTPSVAEAAALLAATSYPATLQKDPPIEPWSQLLVKKQIIRHADQPGTVTVAIAQADWEYTDRIDKL